MQYPVGVGTIEMCGSVARSSGFGVEVVSTVTIERVDELAHTGKSLLSNRGHHGSSNGASQTDEIALQKVADAYESIARELGKDLEGAWVLLAGGRIGDPREMGQQILLVYHRLRAMLTELEQDLGALIDEGLSDTDLSGLVETRTYLEREAGRFQRDWPMVSPDEVHEARERYDAIPVVVTFAEAARVLGYGPEEAPRELPAPGWSHLVSRRHPWKRQLFIRGRNMTVRQLVGTVRANGWDEGEAADAMDLPAEAIREATTYANANEELLVAEAEYERLSLALRGLGSDTRPVPR